MRFMKKVAAFSTAAVLVLGGLGTPVFAADNNASGAFVTNEANENSPIFESGNFRADVRFSAENKNGHTETSSSVHVPSNPIEQVTINNVKSMAVTGQIKNTSSNTNTGSIQIYLPAAYTALYASFGVDTQDMRVDTKRVSDVNSLMKSSNPQSKVKINYVYTGTDKTPSQLEKIQLNGEWAPGETFDINIPMTTPALNKENIIQAWIGGNYYEEKIKAIQKYDKVVDIADLEGAKIYPAISEDNNGTGTYKVWEDLIPYMPTMSKNLIIASNKQSVLPDASKNPDFSTIQSDDALYTNSQYLIKTEPIFDAIKDHGYSTYSDVLDNGTRGFWNSYAYGMQASAHQLVNQDGEPYKIDQNGNKRHFYVQVHKVLDAEDLYLNVGDSWDNYDNLTYHKTVRKNTADSTDIPTDKIKVEDNVDTSRAGVYDVKYLYDVAPGKTVTISAKVYVNGAPELELKDASIKEGEDLDLKSLVVSATDKEDGDLTDKLEISDNGGFDNTKEGTYTITFKVADSKGITTTKTATVTVRKEWTAVNAAPSLTVKDATIKEGEDLDLKTLIMSATDAEDGDLTNKVEITDNGGFDNTKDGKYTVTYKVTDSQGASTTKTATVTVLAPEKPAQPSVDNNTDATGTQGEKSDNASVPETGDPASLAVAGLTLTSAMSAAAAFVIKNRKRK